MNVFIEVKEQKLWGIDSVGKKHDGVSFMINIVGKEKHSKTPSGALECGWDSHSLRSTTHVLGSDPLPPDLTFHTWEEDRELPLWREFSRATCKEHVLSKEYALSPLDSWGLNSTALP